MSEKKKGPILHLAVIMLFSAGLAIIGTDELHKRYLKGEFKKGKESQAAAVVSAQRDDESFKLSEARASYKHSDEHVTEKDKSWLDFITGESDNNE